MFGKCMRCLTRPLYDMYGLVREIINKRIEEELNAPCIPDENGECKQRGCMSLHCHGVEFKLSKKDQKIAKELNDRIKEMNRTRTIICCERHVKHAFERSKAIGAEISGHDPFWTPGPNVEVRKDGSRCDFCDSKLSNSFSQSPMDHDPQDTTARNPANAGCGVGGKSGPLRTYNFSEALGLLKDGVAVSRRGWHAQGMYIKLQPQQSTYNKVVLAHIVLTLGRMAGYIEKSCVPWLASQTDLLSDDWYIVSPD